MEGSRQRRSSGAGNRQPEARRSPVVRGGLRTPDSPRPSLRLARTVVTFAEQFGANLRYCRRRAKLSQEELGVRASLHRTAVGQLERAERIPRADTVVKLAGSLGIHAGELLEGLGWTPGGTRLGSFETSDPTS